MERRFVRKVVLGFLAVALSGAGLVGQPAAGAAAAEYWCYNTITTHDGIEWGGIRLCEYGWDWHRFPNGTEQVFIIGTDHAVWTRWRHNSSFSEWKPLYGKVRHGDHRSLWLTGSGNNPRVNVIGTDGRTWWRVRHTNGVWSNWTV
jgi:hypothetical protein